METKANPSRTGCLAYALPREPMFILLARDPDAPAAIQFWAERRAQRQVEEPTIELARDAEKIVGAVDDMEAFKRWRVEHEGEWRGQPPVLMLDMLDNGELEDIIWRALEAADREDSNVDRSRSVVAELRRAAK